MLTVVPEHLVTAEGAIAKPDVAHPKLAHSERSELVGPIAEPGQRSTARRATAEAHHRRVFLRVRTVLSERKSYMYTQWEPTALLMRSSEFRPEAELLMTRVYSCRNWVDDSTITRMLSDLSMPMAPYRAR